MTYSCSDFTDDVLNALKLDIPDDFDDSPSDQADMALTEIERLQAGQCGLVLDNEETAIILAGLRMIQRVGVAVQEEDIATDGGEFDVMGDDEIDELCERLNCGYAPVAPAPDLLKALKDLRRELDTIKGHWTEGLDNYAQQADAAIAAAKSAPVAPASADTSRIDWLQNRVVDTIYLDDGKIVDVRGNDLREAIDAATKKWPSALEDDEGDEKSAGDEGQDDRAAAEGWCILENEAGTALRLAADPDSEIFVRNGFSHDDEAEAFVRARAAAGSDYHIAALARVIPIGWTKDSAHGFFRVQKLGDLSGFSAPHAGFEWNGKVYMRTSKDCFDYDAGYLPPPPADFLPRLRPIFNERDCAQSKEGTETMTTITATYSPDDNKIRLYPSQRLDAEIYARVKAAGFKWAPKQELFVAPAWSPNREDLALELAGEIDDEDKSLVDRAEVRAERFEEYGEKRMADAESARKAVAAIADNIPFGQPILVGHHSERHARRDAEKIDAGMRKSVKLWRTSQYWEARAAGALQHARYKELPEVRARRIKTIEADKRKVEREKANAEKQIKAWQVVAGINDAEKQRTAGLAVANSGGYWSMSFSLADYPRDPPASQYEGPMGLWSAIDGGVITAAQAAAIAIPAYERSLPRKARWLEHYDFRLTYERAMLAEAGASHLLAPKPRRELPPLLNYRAPGGLITTANQYDRNRDVTYPQVDMTKAEYAKINSDYKGARWSKDKSHRFRTAMKNGSLVAVFLTDSKAHEIPTPGTPADKSAEIADRLAELDMADAAKAAALALTDQIETLPAAADLPAPSPTTDFEAMATTLRAGGVQIVTAPQLFPTPMDLARDMVEVADLAPGMDMLEPSAGTGRIVRAIREKLGTPDGAAADGLVAVEIKPNLAETVLRGGLRVPTHCADFLECTPERLGLFDRILMNSPFENGADIRHIEHARSFLKPGGRLVAICADGPRQRAKLQPVASEWRSLPPGSFKESGTMVNTALLVIDG